MNKPNDVLKRLQLALPRVSLWIDELHARYQATAVSVERLGMTQVASYFPPSLLRNTRTVIVPKVPFPPVTEYGLAEFEGMAAMPMAGITFRNMYFLTPAFDRESIHCHELVHAIQWRVLGFDDFLLTYAAGVLQHGYADSPLEAEAYQCQARFERREPLPDLMTSVEAGALRARDAATALFRASGLTMGA